MTALFVQICIRTLGRLPSNKYKCKVVTMLINRRIACVEQLKVMQILRHVIYSRVICPVLCRHTATDGYHG